MKNLIKTFFVLILLAVVGGGLFFGRGFFGHESPPTLSLFSDNSMYQATVIGRANGFLRFNADDVAGWRDPSGRSVNLQVGTHFYYSDEDLKITDLIDSIKPVLYNEIVVLYYSPDESRSGLNQGDGFYTFPDLTEFVTGAASSSDIYGFSNDDRFTIPAYRPFIIVSKQQSKIFSKHANIYGEDDEAPTSYTFTNPLSGGKTGWVVVPVQGNNLGYLKNSEGFLDNVFIQNGENSFEEVDFTDFDDTDATDFFILWLKVKEAEVVPACDDGIDNDSDGKIDFGTGTNNDPGCSSATDDNESDNGVIGSDKAITALSVALPGGGSADGAINDTAKTISVSVPSGTNVTALVPTITITGTSISPASGVARNFTNPVTYTVTAADSTTQSYTVTVTVSASSAKSITSFIFTNPAATGVINESASTISVTVPAGTNVTALVPTITYVGTSVEPASGVSRNFTNPVTYLVRSETGTVRPYVVTVTGGTTPPVNPPVITSPQPPVLKYNGGTIDVSFPGRKGLEYSSGITLRPSAWSNSTNAAKNAIIKGSDENVLQITYGLLSVFPGIANGDPFVLRIPKASLTSGATGGGVVTPGGTPGGQPFLTSDLVFNFTAEAPLPVYEVICPTNHQLDGNADRIKINFPQQAGKTLTYVGTLGKRVTLRNEKEGISFDKVTSITFAGSMMIVEYKDFIDDTAKYLLEISTGAIKADGSTFLLDDISLDFGAVPSQINCPSNT
jgi:hypothetical protein